MSEDVITKNNSNHNYYCTLVESGDATTADTMLFSASLEAEPVAIEGGIYSYESNAIYPKFNDTDTSVEEEDGSSAIVLSTTQPLRPFFKANGYGVHKQPWHISDSDYHPEPKVEFEVSFPSYAKPSLGRGARRPVGKVSTILVAWNVLNMMMNLSILALPYAVAMGGFAALAAIPVIGTMSGYTGKLLVDCMYEHSSQTQSGKKKRRARLDYIELGMDFTNRSIGGKLVHSLQILDMLAACILNINVLGALCFEVLQKYASIQLCSVIGVAFAFPTFFIRKINFIAWMQVAAAISLVVGLLLIEGFALASIPSWSVSKIPICDFERLPISIGIIIHAFGIHPVLPGLEQQMSQPKQYRPMLVFTFTVAILVKMFIASTNALMYGQKTEQVITVDLWHHYGLGLASASFLFISVLCLFALPTFVIMEGVDNAMLEVFPCLRRNSEKYKIWLSVFNRCLIMAVSLVFAILIPHFGLLMAFFGNTLSTLLSLTIPCMFHLKIKRDHLRWYHFVFNSLVIALSIFLMASGVFFTCKELHKRL